MGSKNIFKNKFYQLAGIGLAVLASAPAYAVSQSAQLTLSATVPASVNITATGSGSYNSLDLSASQANAVVASVTEQSNDPNGYTVKISSANAGLLQGAQNSVTYTARYNGTAFTLSTTPQTVTTVASQSAIVNTSKDLDISYTGVPSYTLFAGSYSDTLTFTITGN